jgi:hypothetical protein
MAGTNCNCSQAVANNGSALSKTSEQAFETFWPSGAPFPPTVPWLYGMVSRHQAKNVMRRRARGVDELIAAFGDPLTAGLALIAHYQNSNDPDAEALCRKKKAGENCYNRLKQCFDDDGNLTEIISQLCCKHPDTGELACVPECGVGSLPTDETTFPDSGGTP